MTNFTSVITSSPPLKSLIDKVMPIEKVAGNITAQDESGRNYGVLYPKVLTRPPRVVSSNGNYLHTDTGVEIFDATGGAAVACIGHNDWRVKNAILKQLNQVEYCYSPFFSTIPAENLAALLVESTGNAMTRVFIVSSGAEAIEASLKMARQYFLELPQPQSQRTKFIARGQAYHGNTLGALSVGSHVARRAIYEPILAQNVAYVSPCYPYRNQLSEESAEQYVERLARELEDTFQAAGPDTVCAFVAETVSGCATALPGYFKAMKKICEKYGALLVLDEVMSGMGRTGTLHAWEQEGIVPDLQTVAKGLGAGYVPIGALLIKKEVVDVLTRGTGAFSHSQTYQAHPIACAAAYEVQQIVKSDRLLQNVSKLGPLLGIKLKEKLGCHKNVGDIRGRGFFWALELVQDKATKEPFPSAALIASTLHKTGLTQGFGISLLPTTGLVTGIDGDAIIVAPAYNITLADVDTIVERTEMVIRHVLG